MFLGKVTQKENLFFDGHIANRKEEKILDIIIENALLFDSHIKEVCKKASEELATLSRLEKYFELEERNFHFAL